MRTFQILSTLTFFKFVSGLFLSLAPSVRNPSIFSPSVFHSFFKTCLYHMNLVVVVVEDTPRNCLKREVDLMLESLCLVTGLLISGTL